MKITKTGTAAAIVTFTLVGATSAFALGTGVLTNTPTSTPATTPAAAEVTDAVDVVAAPDSTVDPRVEQVDAILSGSATSAGADVNPVVDSTSADSPDRGTRLGEANDNEIGDARDGSQADNTTAESTAD